MDNADHFSAFVETVQPDANAVDDVTSRALFPRDSLGSPNCCNSWNSEYLTRGGEWRGMRDPCLVEIDMSKISSLKLPRIVFFPPQLYYVPLYCPRGCASGLPGRCAAWTR